MTKKLSPRPSPMSCSAAGNDKNAERITFLEKQVLEAERVIEVLVVAGFVTAEKVKEARDLVQSFTWKA